MNKYIAVILLTVSILPYGNPAFADFEKALEAYQSGDYISALKLYKKAAEQSEGDTTLISRP